MSKKKYLLSACIILCFGFGCPAFGVDLLVNGFYSNNVLRYDTDTLGFVDEFVAAHYGGLAYPEDIMIGPDGNLLVSSPAFGIKKFDVVSGIYLGDFASCIGAREMAMGPEGDVYVSQEPVGIVRYDGITGAYKGQFTTLPVSSHGMLFNNDYLYVTDVYYNKVYRFNAQTGEQVDILISGGRLNHPEGILLGDDGLLYIANGYTDEILRYNPDTGSFIDTFVTAGSGGLDEPQDMIFGPDGYFYVSGYGSSSINRYHGTTGAYLDTIATGTVKPTNILMIPEPSVILLLGVGGLMLTTRRKMK